MEALQMSSECAESRTMKSTKHTLLALGLLGALASHLSTVSAGGAQHGAELLIKPQDGHSSHKASASQAERGFKSLFNGRDLKGWAGRAEHWSVEDGAITGRTTKEHPARGNTFLIAQHAGANRIISDFELRLSFKIVPNSPSGFGNSGIQYRSKDRGNFVVNGYQADFECGTTYSGILYEEGGRGILAQRGQKVVIRDNPEKPGNAKIEVTGSVGESAAIQAAIRKQDWNDYVVIARGDHLQHFINGHQTVDVHDEQAAKAAKSGILALQLHAGDPMTVQFKNIRIRELH